MTPTEQDKELREAIRKDFHQLLVKEFTADWKIQRIVRDLEIDVISLDNTMQLITADRKRVALEARKDQTFKVIQSLVKSGSISDSSSSRALMVFDAGLKAQQEKL